MRDVCASRFHTVCGAAALTSENELVITFSGDNRPFRKFLFLALNVKLIRLGAV